MNKRCVLVHGWGGVLTAPWFPWLKQQLQDKGFEVLVPDLPHADKPTIDDWVEHLAVMIGQFDENTYFVGHSVGCQTILRYLETINGGKVGQVICVAGWFVLSGLEEEEQRIAKPWLETPIDFEKVKRLTSSISAIFSDDDPYVPLEENKKIFEQQLGARVVIESSKGHYTSEDGVKQIPAVLDAFLRYP